MMKSGDIVAVSKNPIIKLATFSTWSHVAIALDDKYVLEALPIKGVVKNTLADCVGSSKHRIYQRPEPLTEEQKSTLSSLSQEMISSNLPYSWHRAGYSGLVYIFRNIFLAFSIFGVIASVILFFFLEDMHRSYAFLLISVVATFIGLPLSKLSGMTKQINSKLKQWNAPNFLMTNMDPQYCSQLVEEVDEKIGGNISRVMKRESELRPIDIIAACEIMEWGYLHITKSSKQKLIG